MSRQVIDETTHVTVERAAAVHLVGINGTGMSSLASLLLDMDKQVTGCDLQPGHSAEWLESRGARIYQGHSADHLGSPDLVVISSAVPMDNPEVAAAARQQIRVIKHAQALGELTAARISVAVAGTHGKSTTTALVAFLLDRAGLSPTYIGGAESLDFGASGRLGQGEHLVVEADEYDRRFLELAPRIAIVTSVEPDHLDYFHGLDEIMEAFQSFLGRLPHDGVAIVCRDDPVLMQLKVARGITYGFHPDANYHIASYQARRGYGPNFSVRPPDGEVRSFELPLLGRHNAANACAALAAARELGVGWEMLLRTLPAFRGTRRRFERVGVADGVEVVDDYAHHPTAVRATLQAAREWHGGPVWVAFQPHTTHRTAALLEDFAASLRSADRAFILPIYEPAGREHARQSVTSADLAARAADVACVCSSFEEVAQRVVREAAPGSLIITMGAGDVTKLGPLLLNALEQRRR